MIEFEKHISELLKKNECVILPGVGGFILHDREGFYDRRSSQFFPPSRVISFNGLLNGDDGLLLSHLCAQENLAYPDAKSRLGDFTGKILTEAKSEQGADIAGIGRLSLSEEGKLQFFPLKGTNLLDSSFGLAPVSAQASSATAPLVSRPRSMKLREDRRQDTPAPMTPSSVRWSVALALPVILFLLWGIIFPSSFQHYYTSYSGILTEIFENKQLPGNEIQADQLTDKTIENKTEQVVLQEDATVEPAVEGTDDIPVLADGLKESNVEVKVDAPPQPLLIYHVIGGVFSNEENAGRYVEALTSLGYHARLVGTNKRGQFRVSYESFESWSKAAYFLESIKETENPSAWILKY